MNTYYYLSIGQVYPIDTKAENEQEARAFFRDWLGVKRLTGQFWKK